MDNNATGGRPRDDACEPLTVLQDLVSALGDRSRSPNTRRSYQGAWTRFEVWATGSNLVALPALPETLALYVANLFTQGRRWATIEQAVVAISQKHADAGYESPRNDRRVRRVLRGVRREVGREPVAKAPLLPAHVERLSKMILDDARGRRDLALLAVGVASGLRRAELAALDVEDIKVASDALTIVLRRSKTDAFGRGRSIIVGARGDRRDCPVHALRAWLEAGRITSGPLFRPVSRSGSILDRRLDERTIARVVKARVHDLGLDKTQFAGHSLRAGYATAAADAGVAETRIMKTLGHSTLLMTARYIRNVKAE